MKQTSCCLTHLPCNLPCKKLIELMNIFTLIFKHYMKNFVTKGFQFQMLDVQLHDSIKYLFVIYTIY